MMVNLTVCGVYMITSINTGLLYIGSSKDINRRFYQHRRELKKGEHYNKRMQRTINKFGQQDFIYQILEETTEENLLEVEQKYIDSLGVCNKEIGFNVSEIARNNFRSSTRKEAITEVTELGRPPKIKREYNKSSQEGLKENWTRYTVIIREDLLERLKNNVHEQDKTMKAVINEMIGSYLDTSLISKGDK